MSEALMLFDAESDAVSVTVVDDEPLAQDVLVRAARGWRYRCQTANSAEQALRLLERQLTPLVVTDLLMPGRDGYWLIGEIRRRWPEVGVIVLTGGHDPESAEKCLRAGADHYFLKPINLDEFRQTLDTAWRTYQGQQKDREHRAELERAVRTQTRRVRRTYLSAIDSLVRTMEERDAYTAGHSLRVHDYALRLADAVGVTPRQRRRLSLAAKLHDLGKIAIPEAILHKNGPLNPDETRVVQEHPGTAERILRPVIRDREVLAAIRGHHERRDGGGYPDGLAGDRIPLLARLIAVPDCFDALTTCRPYRAAVPVTEALRLLAAGMGTHFEPAFVEAFTRLVR